VLELELYPGGEERGAFEQAGNHRVGALADQAAEPLRNSRILIGEIACLLVQQRQLAIVQIEKLAIHRR
jgi:hypothetical protein